MRFLSNTWAMWLPPISCAIICRRHALLLEHKSYVDQWVGFQVLKYGERYWEHDLQESSKLSPVVPVVVYHGTENWTVATRFVRKLEGLKDPHGSLNQTIGRYTPDRVYNSSSS